MDALYVRLAHPAHILITTHQKPDGDAMGSGLALYHYLRNLGQRPVFLSPTPYADYFQWMPGAEHTAVFTDNETHYLDQIAKADVIFCVDFGELHRATSTVGRAIHESAAIKVNIDHHILKMGRTFAEYNYRDVSASSTCELIYDFIQLHTGSRHLDTNIATCLYTGILTDTGSFRYECTTPKVHDTVADLLRYQVDIGQVNFHLFNNFSEHRTRFIGYALYQCLQVLPEYRTAYFRISLEDQERFGLKEGDTEGLVNYALSIQGINFGVLLKETPEMVKMSFRSLGTFPTNEFAANFMGGGHHNASGGKSELSLAETEQNFLQLLPQFQSQLDYVP